MSVDIHHIFPYKWCIDNKIDPEQRESIVNKTPLSTLTNRKIGGAAPSKYLAAVEKAAGITSEKLDALVSSHQCDPGAMRLDDFDAFFTSRREALVRLVEKPWARTCNATRRKVRCRSRSTSSTWRTVLSSQTKTSLTAAKLPDSIAGNASAVSTIGSPPAASLPATRQGDS